MFCTSCGTNFEGTFCPGCGSRAGQATAIPGAPAAVATEVGLRCGAYLIDVIPAMIVAFILGWVPIMGAMIAGFILFCYWLLRDITGGSLGKLILGLKVVKKVVKKDGQESGTKERVLRNVPLPIGPALLIIPLAGMGIGPVVAGLIGITEALLLLAKHERLGDMLAGTTVVKKTAMARAAAAWRGVGDRQHRSKAAWLAVDESAP